jgi:Zn-dependent peptidase ImmA (M78 family)
MNKKQHNIIYRNLKILLKKKAPDLLFKEVSYISKSNVNYKVNGIIVGYYSIKYNCICVLKSDPPLEKILTLLHEFGHYFSRGDQYPLMIRDRIRKINIDYRNYDEMKEVFCDELSAYFYGWCLICEFQIKSLITKKMWRDMHMNHSALNDCFNNAFNAVIYNK